MVSKRLRFRASIARISPYFGSRNGEGILCSRSREESIPMRIGPAWLRTSREQSGAISRQSLAFRETVLCLREIGSLSLPKSLTSSICWTRGSSRGATETDPCHRDESAKLSSTMMAKVARARRVKLTEIRARLRWSASIRQIIYVYTYIHTYVRAYTHTYIHTHIYIFRC